jgi:hypothetical protein
MTPNFFVVGAPKAGTTSLYQYLRQHPAVYMSPIKEPCFFAPEVVDFTPESRAMYEKNRAAVRAYLDGPLDHDTSGIVLEWNDYLKLFKNVKGETAIGEVSGNYLASSSAAAAIRERIPDARIIIMLRDPVDRLYSQYVAARAHGLTRTDFARWSMEQVSEEATRQPPFGAAWTGRYAEHLQRFQKHFPASQIHVSFYDEYAANPQAVVRNLFWFLGVDPAPPIDVRTRHNVTLLPRLRRLRPFIVSPLKPVLRLLPKPLVSRLGRMSYTTPARPSQDERTRVIAIYDADIRALEALTGRTLAKWRT